MLRKWLVCFALIVCVVVVAGCGEQPAGCDDICQAKHQQELQSVQIATEADATLSTAFIRGTQILVATSLATLIIIVGEAMVYGWRSHVFPAYTPDQRWQEEQNADVAKAIAAAQRYEPANIVNNYDVVDAGYREVDEEPLQLIAPPVAPSWQQLEASGFVATPERFALAYSGRGVELVDLNGNSSVAIIGRSGQGKTTALRFYVKQAAMFGGCVVFDPHGAIIPVAGMARVAHANSNNRGQMDDLATKLNAELDRRLDRYAQEVRAFTPITVFADELPSLSQQSGAVVNVLGRVVLEGRKVKMFIVLAGQGIPAAILEAAIKGRRIAGSLYRDSFTVRVAFSASERMAAMVGFSGEECQLIDELGDAPGKCYVEGPMRLTFCAIPNIAAADLTGPLQLARPTVQEQATIRFAEPISEPLRTDAGPLRTDAGPLRTDNWTDEEKQILTLLGKGHSISSTVQEMWNATKGGGRVYMEGCAKVNAVIAKLANAHRSSSD